MGTSGLWPPLFFSPFLCIIGIQIWHKAILCLRLFTNVKLEVDNLLLRCVFWRLSIHCDLISNGKKGLKKLVCLDVCYNHRNMWDESLKLCPPFSSDTFILCLPMRNYCINFPSLKYVLVYCKFEHTILPFFLQ